MSRGLEGFDFRSCQLHSQPAGVTVSATATLSRRCGCSSPLQTKKPGPPSQRRKARVSKASIGESLEDELQPKLYLAWRPSAADFGVAGLGAGLAKLDGAAAARVNRLPLRVIERVERLRSELDGGVLTPKPGRLEFLVERQVPIVPAGTG